MPVRVRVRQAAREVSVGREVMLKKKKKKEGKGGRRIGAEPRGGRPLRRRKPRRSPRSRPRSLLGRRDPALTLYHLSRVQQQ